MPVPREVLEEIALTPDEYALICRGLGREPNPLELGMFAALWSEHCGYKHSKNLLKRLPSASPRLLVRPGEENAGVVDIGHGWAIAMKIESHNHPSAVEPFQGAATGVGGIVRDILTMGARPIALLNSLRFGPLSDPRSRYLYRGVVGGISWYGNCIGVPDVGGEVFFSPAYAKNPLVNAMCVGLLRADRLVRARASEPGSFLMLVGADTGRDGIHGASALASRTFTGERELRPTVQVGNPFLEKVLIEACLEALERCWDGIVGMQDLGAAGLTSATVESAGRGGCGVRVDVSRVPRREQGMTPYEVMLSESQERMLVIVRRGWEERLTTVFAKWDLTSAIVGEVTDDGLVRVYDGSHLEGVVPIRLLVDAPRYDLHPQKPEWLTALQREDLSALPEPPLSPTQALLRLLASPNIASREPIYRQYDHQVLINTVVPPGAADAAVLRIKGTPTRIALACDGNGRLTFLDPRAGGAISVAEACRNLACVGAEPVALTDGLNFGDPERPVVAYQMEECITGMAEACRALGVPIISGNVSLYNETDSQPIYPTAMVGALGLLERHTTAAFRHEGDVVFLLGADAIRGDPSTLAGSEFLEVVYGKVAGRPTIDLNLEARVQRLCRRAVGLGLLSSAHDCSEGGLAVALAECAILGEKGFRGSFPIQGHWAPALFGEAQSRIVVSLAEAQVPALLGLAQEEGVPLLRLGQVGGDRFMIPPLIDVPLDVLQRAWRSGLEVP
ncbi:MAG: phosphoribosylformylglycinamidine synthase subunit PurL [Dehalococcoidia bacterium]|nr:phosphoribosylformylglycinamidine synthase subunit PurL [Dehalococcoidia bacterium]MDW8119801.1 phosphoribosylformylglycinamidine synthase subunit PurL [Chloroflexota bacterium]